MKFRVVFPVCWALVLGLVAYAHLGHGRLTLSQVGHDLLGSGISGLVAAGILCLIFRPRKQKQQQRPAYQDAYSQPTRRRSHSGRR